ncbi:MAG: flagellar type III secretion system protein FliR [Gorillibacterium sp.]|nr:flagellar type III secretion system protein FliR [Gorillibacterium sp.]
MEWILDYFPAFLLIFCRITAFFVTAPIFSSRNIPVLFKIGLSSFITLLTASVIEVTPMVLDGQFIIAIAKETLIGLLLGFIAYLFFTVVQIAGSFVDMQIGFSMANIINPMTGTQTPVLGNLYYMVGMLLFLASNGHHMFIKGILKSYQWIPLNNDTLARFQEGNLTEFLIRSLSEAFGLALQMSAPLVVALFLVDVGLGILARVAPQFNIFVVGIPIKIIVGLLLLSLFVTGFPVLFRELFTIMMREMENLLRLLAGGKT